MVELEPEGPGIVPCSYTERKPEGKHSGAMPRVTVPDAYISEPEGDSVNVGPRQLDGGVNTVVSFKVVAIF